MISLSRKVKMKNDGIGGLVYHVSTGSFYYTPALVRWAAILLSTGNHPHLLEAGTGSGSHSCQSWDSVCSLPNALHFALIFVMCPMVRHHTLILFDVLFTKRVQSLGGSEGKESACNAGDPCLIPGFGRPPGEGNGDPLQYSCLENSINRGAWWAPGGLHTVPGVTKSWTWLKCQALGFPPHLVITNPPANARDTCSISG